MKDIFKILGLLLLFLLPFSLISQSGVAAKNRPLEGNLVSTHVNDNSVLLFPNPSSEEITISTKDGSKIYSVRILNLAGSELFRKERINRSRRKIDIADFVNGVYSLEIILEDHRRLFKKIVKK